MSPSSGVRGKYGEQIFQSQIPCAGSFGCQRIHVILKATTTSLKERGNIYGKIDFSKRGCQIAGDQHCNFGCSAQQRADFLCSVCAERLCVFYRCGPPGVYRKMHPSCKAGGKKHYISQAAKRTSLSNSVSLLEPTMSDKTKVQRWRLCLGGDGIGQKANHNSSIWHCHEKGCAIL